LADEEYAKMQNEISKRLKNKDFNKENKKKLQEEIGAEMLDDNISALILSNLVMQEQTFYYALTTNHKDMTMEQASELLDVAIEEYGNEAITELCSTLMENFTQRGEQPKKKMVMRMS
jgi:Cdc6-like AAA superfamily ATPase